MGAQEPAVGHQVAIGGIEELRVSELRELLA